MCLALPAVLQKLSLLARSYCASKERPRSPFLRPTVETDPESGYVHFWWIERARTLCNLVIVHIFRSQDLSALVVATDQQERGRKCRFMSAPDWNGVRTFYPRLKCTTDIKCTPVYFLYRDVPTVWGSFSGSPVLNRVYNFTFSCLKQGVQFHIFVS